MLLGLLVYLKKVRIACGFLGEISLSGLKLKIKHSNPLNINQQTHLLKIEKISNLKIFKKWPVCAQRHETLYSMHCKLFHNKDNLTTFHELNHYL